MTKHGESVCERTCVSEDEAISLLTDAGNADVRADACCSWCRDPLVSAFGPLCHECQLALLGEHEYLGRFGLCIHCGRPPTAVQSCGARRRQRVAAVLGQESRDG